MPLVSGLINTVINHIDKWLSNSSFSDDVDVSRISHDMFPEYLHARTKGHLWLLQPYEPELNVSGDYPPSFQPWPISEG